MKQRQMEEKKREEEKMLKQQEEQKKANTSLPMPQGKKQGAGAGQAGQSRKKSTIDDMNQKRQQLSSAG
jgi:hypothetical protein